MLWRKPLGGPRRPAPLRQHPGQRAALRSYGDRLPEKRRPSPWSPGCPPLLRPGRLPARCPLAVPPGPLSSRTLLAGRPAGRLGGGVGGGRLGASSAAGPPRRLTQVPAPCARSPGDTPLATRAALIRSRPEPRPGAGGQPGARLTAQVPAGRVQARAAAGGSPLTPTRPAGGGTCSDHRGSEPETLETAGHVPLSRGAPPVSRGRPRACAPAAAPEATPHPRAPRQRRARCALPAGSFGLRPGSPARVLPRLRSSCEDAAGSEAGAALREPRGARDRGDPGGWTCTGRPCSAALGPGPPLHGRP